MHVVIGNRHKQVVLLDLAFFIIILFPFVIARFRGPAGTLQLVAIHCRGNVTYLMVSFIRFARVSALFPVIPASVSLPSPVSIPAPTASTLASAIIVDIHSAVSSTRRTGIRGFSFPQLFLSSALLDTATHLLSSNELVIGGFAILFLLDILELGQILHMR